MSRSLSEKHLILLLSLALILPFSKSIFPIILPFAFGLILALAAEPAVLWIHQKLRLSRVAAAGIGVTGIFILSATFLTLFLSLLIRQLGQLSALLPAISAAITQGATLLEKWLLSIAEKMPAALRSVISGWIEALFSGSTGILHQAAGKLPQLAGNALGKLSSGFIGGVTMVLSAFMISARLPLLRQQLLKKLPEHSFSAAKGFRKALGKWILAQGKLAGVAFILLWLGFMILRVENHLLWATIVTTVDILPILGVGTVLLPWSLVSYLQGNSARAIGLLCLFSVIWLVRSVLEPRFVGKGLGLDPLITLLCIYAGFQLWGIVGMLLAPLAAVCIVQFLRQKRYGGSPDTA